MLKTDSPVVDTRVDNLNSRDGKVDGADHISDGHIGAFQVALEDECRLQLNVRLDELA